MSSAGKWILGLLLLVLGAVFVARTVSSDPASNATVKKLPSAETVAKSEKVKAPPAPATDVACKKACIEVNEVANDSVTTAKLAPGSVTLSKLAFEVPNLNELENEINARKAAEAASKAAAAETKVALGEAAAATAKNDAAITAAAQNGLVAEAAARAAAVDDITKKFTAGDADLLGRLNKEIADRGAGDDVLQLKLNAEIADRAGAISTLRGELGNPNQVAAPIIKINNNEIVGDAVTTDKLLDGTIQTQDLANAVVVNSKLGGDAVTTDKIKDGEVKTSDIADQNVTTAKIAERNITTSKLRGTEFNDTDTDKVRAVTAAALGDSAVINRVLAANSVTSDKIAAGEVTTSDIANENVTTVKIADLNVTNGKLGGDAVTSSKIKNGEVQTEDIADAAVTLPKLAPDSVDSSKIVNGSIATADIGNLQVTLGNLAGDSVDSSKIANGSIVAEDLESGFLASLVTEDEFGARLRDPADTTVNQDADPVSWFKLRDVPDSLSGASNTSLGCSGCVGNAQISDVDASKITGTITAAQLAGGITGDKISDGTITSGDLAGTYSADPGNPQTVVGAVTSEKIADGTIQGRDLADGAVGMTKLGTDVATRFADLEARALALESRVGNLGTAPGPGDADRVITTRLTGQATVVASLDPAAVPATSRSEHIIVMPVAGQLQVGDLVTVSPPALLDDDLLFVGHDVQDRIVGTGVQTVVVVYLYNNTAAAIDDVANDWKIQYLDLTP